MRNEPVDCYAEWAADAAGAAGSPAARPYDVLVTNPPYSGDHLRRLCAHLEAALAPRGMALIEWEPDPDRGEMEATLMWLLLDPRPGKWNGDAHRAWRYHPAELAKRERAQREQQKQP